MCGLKPPSWTPPVTMYPMGTPWIEVLLLNSDINNFGGGEGARGRVGAVESNGLAHGVVGVGPVGDPGGELGL
jgi:hypothetical protein